MVLLDVLLARGQLDVPASNVVIVGAAGLSKRPVQTRLIVAATFHLKG